MNLQEANKALLRVICPSISERDRIVKALHQKGITHITMGAKNYMDYEQRVRKGIYSEQHNVICFYGADFFSIMTEEEMKRYQLTPSSEVQLD